MKNSCNNINFYFTLSANLTRYKDAANAAANAPQLQENTYFFTSLHNSIELSLVRLNFIPNSITQIESDQAIEQVEFLQSCIALTELVFEDFFFDTGDPTVNRLLSAASTLRNTCNSIKHQLLAPHQKEIN
jgi:hypothetical protein